MEEKTAIEATYVCGMCDKSVKSKSGMPEGWQVPRMAPEGMTPRVPPRHTVYAACSKECADDMASRALRR